MPRGKKTTALTERQAVFVREYLADLNATRAAAAAGYSKRTAKSTAHELMLTPKIQDAIQAAMKARADRLDIKADDVLRRLWGMANADTRELIEFRRGCCRYCWGAGHRYQRTAGEMERDRIEWDSLQDKARIGKDFDERGGIGYHAKRDPNPECPECFGDGVGQVHMHDTRSLSPGAAQLYAGVKQGREGLLEVKAHSQHEALRDVGRHLGLFKDRTEVSGPDGSPLIPRKKTDLTDDELAAIAAGRRD